MVLVPILIISVLFFSYRQILENFFATKNESNSIIEIIMDIDDKIKNMPPAYLENIDIHKDKVFRYFAQYNFFSEIIHGKKTDIVTLENIKENNLSFVYFDGKKGSIDVAIDNTTQNITLPKDIAKKLQSYQAKWVDELDFLHISRQIETPQGFITIDLFTSDSSIFLQGISSTSMVNFLLFAGIIFLISTIVILIICFVTSFSITKGIIKPISVLTEASNRVKNGTLSQDIEYNHVDELLPLCQTFNEMQRSLRENIKKQEIYEANRKEMIVGISHDLRTPLTSILSYVQALQDGLVLDREKQQKYLSVIHKKALNMEYLIQQLFQFSKLETENMIFNMENINLDTYIVNFLDKHEEEMRKHNVYLHYSDYQEQNIKSFTVEADTQQINRALHNIIENSLKYSHASPAHIQFFLQKSYDFVELSICDNGIGVEEKYISKIFDSFFCISKARLSEHKGKESGSGLGLSIVKSIMKAHGGFAHAKNNNGLEIVLTFPYKNIVEKV